MSVFFDKILSIISLKFIFITMAMQINFASFSTNFDAKSTRYYQLDLPLRIRIYSQPQVKLLE